MLYRTRTLLLVTILSLVSLAQAAARTEAAVSIVRISSDPYSSSAPGYHRTEVEPDTFSHGTTVVSGFQVGRRSGPGAVAAGWATRINGVWRHGILPRITRRQGLAGPYDRVSDASVAYDARHRVWLISTLAFKDTSTSSRGAAILVSRSSDGLHWSNPIPVAVTGTANYDKNWIVCDNGTSSPYYGRCYAEWDVLSAGDLILMSRSSNGGLTWSAATTPAGRPAGVGGQPLVRPNGSVIVPIANASLTAILAFRSTNGGATWGKPVTVSGARTHNVHGGMRWRLFPSAEIDRGGKVYVTWNDCRFRSGCTANDIVMSTSSDGINWSAIRRIPIDRAGSGVDHFTPGLAVDRTTSGSTARLALTYYYYPLGSSCTASTCRLHVGFVSSVNGGRSWSAPTHLAGPMQLGWLPPTYLGRMVGDYISTSFAGGSAVAIYASAQSPGGGRYNEATYAARAPATGGSVTASLIAPRTQPADAIVRADYRGAGDSGDAEEGAEAPGLPDTGAGGTAARNGGMSAESYGDKWRHDGAYTPCIQVSNICHQGAAKREG